MEQSIHPDRALELILQAATVFPIRTESIFIEQTSGRVLPYPVLSLIDQPPFTKSAMDGYAYNRADSCQEYTIAQTVKAGTYRDTPIGSGETVPIMTGAPIPKGTDAVQRIEWTERTQTGVRFTKPETISNIIVKGENCKAGDIILTPRIITPQDIGILAASGYRTVDVSVPPYVAIISTGDELYEPDCSINEHSELSALMAHAAASLGPAGIYDSNGYQLTAHTLSCGVHAQFLGICKDSPEELAAVLSQALLNFDIVILSGGVSKGDFDFIPAIAKQCGVEPVFHELAMRPGKPTFFGTKDCKAVFGLPGNPVSTFVNFELLVKPLLYKVMGFSYAPQMLQAVLTKDIKRKGSDRVEFFPVYLNFECNDSKSQCYPAVTPLPYHGSSMITALAEANALIRIEQGIEHLSKGEKAYVRLIRPLY